MRHWFRPWVVVLLVLLAAYFFAISVATYWWPGITRSSSFLLYAFFATYLLLLLGVAGVVGAVGFFVWPRRPRRGTPPMSAAPHANWRGLIVVSVGGLLLFGIAAATSEQLHGDLPVGSFARRFDRAVWSTPGSAAYVKGDITPRQKMIGDIVNNILPGRTQSEVAQILGGSEDPGIDKRALAYIIGPDRGFSIDFEWLVIWYDEHGRLQRYEFTSWG